MSARKMLYTSSDYSCHQGRKISRVREDTHWEDILRPPGSPGTLGRQPLLPAQLLKVDDILQIRNEPDRIAATVQSSRPDHADVSHRVPWI